MNRRVYTDRHTPRKAKTAQNLIEEIEALCIVATPGLRPPPPKKKTAEEKLEARQRIDARIRGKEKEKKQRENTRACGSFQKRNGERSIAHKRFWWNEE